MSENWFQCLLGAVGLTIVLTTSHITWPVRYWGCIALRWCGLRLQCPLYCSMCSGVWVGGVMGLLTGHNWLLMAFSTSLVAFVFSTWLKAHGECTKPEHDEEKARRQAR